MTTLDQRHKRLTSFDRMEVRLVRGVLAKPAGLHPRDEAALRYALNLARIVQVRCADGTDADVGELTDELRGKLTAYLGPIVGGEDDRAPVALETLSRAVEPVSAAARATRAKLVVRLRGRLAPDALERELTQRTLVLACGGGGGAGFVNLGAFALLESAGLRPGLLAGSSMGSIVGLFRARAQRFEVAQVPRIMGELSTRRLFRPLSAENRWCLPSAVRLELRTGIGPYFEYDGVPLRLRDMPVPLLVTVTGVRREGLPNPVEHYRKVADDLAAAGNPARGMAGMLSLLKDLTRTPDLLMNLVLGETDETREFDVVDAVGFSSSVPGALHYDLARDAPLEEERIRGLMQQHDLLKLTDGGVVDNVPARTAWNAVQRGMIGTRNCFVLALDGFSPRLSTAVWMPIQLAAAENVRRSKRYAHLYFAFQRTLSPLELIPSAATVMRHVESSKRELIGELPFIQRMMEPLPGQSALRAA